MRLRQSSKRRLAILTLILSVYLLCDSVWSYCPALSLTRTFEGLKGARMFHLVSLSLQISLTDLPGSRLGLCVCVVFVVCFVGLVVGFFKLSRTFPAPGRGPYHEGKGADKGTFKGKDKFPSDWPPLNPGPLPLLPPFSSPPPLLSLKVFAQSGSAQRGSTFCSYHPKWLLAAMSDASRLVLPMIFSYHCALFLCAAYDSGAAMLMDAVDHLMHFCLLALSLLLQVAFLPSQARYSSLLCLFVVSSPPFRRRGGLSGNSLWHIVRPVVQCSSPPLIYPAWVLPSPYYDPSMISFPLFL